MISYGGERLDPKTHLVCKACSYAVDLAAHWKQPTVTVTPWQCKRWQPATTTPR